MALHMGMREFEPVIRKSKLIRFVLDVEKSDKFLANMYKEGRLCNMAKRAKAEPQETNINDLKKQAPEILIEVLVFSLSTLVFL